MRRRGISMLLCAALIAFSLSGCTSAAETPQEQALQVYYLSNDETEIIASDYQPVSSPDNTEAMIDELIEALQTTPAMLEYEAPVSGAVEILEKNYAERILTLNFSDSYTQIPKTTEILLRAAMVRTFTQIDGIDCVAFEVAGAPLMDAHGSVVGNMTAEQFIYNAGREINTYEKVQLVLYFADASGERLLPVYRTVVYNSNILMERLIVEQLIRGPQTAGDDLGIYATMNPSCGIVNISVRDGICYVNLDENFLVQPNAVTAEAAIYSIVNSLAELPEVSRVQISVQGDTAVSYMDMISLSGLFTRNLDIIVTN